MIKFDKCIPHNEDPLLIPDEYNRYMEQSEDWVCFIDSDAMFIHPKWHTILLRAIKNLGKKAGFITCMTNRVGHLSCIPSDCPQDHDIEKHTKYAIENEKKNREVYFNTKDLNPLSGHVILTHREAWEKSGRFRTANKGFLGVDNNYYRDVRKAGYETYIMKDMYVYHRYTRFWKKKDFREWLSFE